MSTGKIIGIILIIAGLFVGYLGINQVAESQSSVEIIGVEIEASNESGKRQGFIYIGLAVVLFAGGIYSMNKR